MMMIINHNNNHNNIILYSTYYHVVDGHITKVFVMKSLLTFLLTNCLVQVRSWLTLWGLGTWNCINPWDWALFGDFLVCLIVMVENSPYYSP